MPLFLLQAGLLQHHFLYAIAITFGGFQGFYQVMERLVQLFQFFGPLG